MCRTTEGNVCTVFNTVGTEPFFRAHAVCPIGRHYILKGKRQNDIAESDPVNAPPNQHLGVPAFTQSRLKDLTTDVRLLTDCKLSRLMEAEAEAEAEAEVEGGWWG
jgi:hypothetical protein